MPPENSGVFNIPLDRYGVGRANGNGNAQGDAGYTEENFKKALDVHFHNVRVVDYAYRDDRRFYWAWDPRGRQT